MSEVVATIRRIDMIYNFMDKVDVLWKEGVRLLRFNLGKTTDYDVLIRDITAVKEKYSGMKVMIDIPYPGEKVRIRSNKSYDVRLGDCFFFCFNDNLCMDSLEPVRLSCRIDLALNDAVLYNDGEGMFTVIEKKDDGYVVEARGDFPMLDSKSISVKSPAKTTFSLKDITSVPMDYLALSFVESPEVIKEVKLLFRDAKIIAKIETLKGVENSRQIIDAADGIMIARGDLGLNVPVKDFFRIEKELAELAKERRKICYAATDIMQTMRNRFFPSRADINDFYNLMTLGVDGYVISLQLAVSDHVSNAFRYMKMMDERLQ